MTVRPEDVQVSTARYEFSHIKPPSNDQEGHWAFEIDGQEVFIEKEVQGVKTFTLRYDDAVAMAKVIAADKGIRRIAVLP